MPLGAARFGLSGADLGKLELIQTLSADNSSQILDFDSILTSDYNVNFITFSDYQSANDSNKIVLRLKNASGEISSGYQIANQRVNVPSDQVEARSTSSSFIRLMDNGGNNTNEKANGYIYIYNANDSSKYTFITLQTTYVDLNGNYTTEFGSAVHPTAETITGFLFRNLTVTGSVGNINTLDVSLYGIKES